MKQFFLLLVCNLSLSLNCFFISLFPDRNEIFQRKKNTHIDLWKQATEILEWVSYKLDKQFGYTMCLCGDSFHQIVINFIRFPLFRNEIALQFFILSAECDNCWYSPATESLSIHMQLLLLLWFSSKLNMKFSFHLCWLREFMKIAISTDGQQNDERSRALFRIYCFKINVMTDIQCCYNNRHIFQLCPLCMGIPSLTCHHQNRN